MDATELHNLIECPHCGAKLAPAGPDGIRRCEYCEASFQAAPPTTPPQMQPPPNLGGWSAVNVTSPGPQASTAPMQASSSGCGVVAIVVVLIVIASIAIPLYFVARGVSGFSSLLADKPDGNVAVAPSADGRATTMYTVVRRLDGGTTKYAVVRIDAGHSTPVWTSADLTGTSGSQSPLLTDGTLVFIPNGERLVALKASDGTVAWQAGLTDEFQASCKDCFFLAGPRLVIETKDSNYQAFDPATGAPAWNRKTVDVSAYATPFGEQTMILDDDLSHNGVILLINPDGTEAAKLQPSCLAKGSRTPDPFDNDANVVPLPGDNAAVFGYGSPYPCWQRIDFTTGEPAWTTVLDNSSFPSGRSDTYVVTQGTKAAIVGDKYLATLDLATGEYKPVNEIADTQMYPLGLRENTLVLRTANERGTKKYAINAVDLTTGQGVWNVDLGKAEPADGPGASTIFLSTGDARFTSSLDGATLHVVVFDHDSRQLNVTNVNMADGQKTPTSVASGVDDTLPNFEVGAWRGPSAVINFKGAELVVLDTATAAVISRYP